EAQLVRAAYRFAARNQRQTARLLGISRNIVRARLIELGEISSATRRPPPPAPDLPPTNRRAP
ncbi:MAG TPA: AAA family ATPase, partial [Polyangia bacterium]|nr:AAA family ATPase [Polyangia bacterium]